MAVEKRTQVYVGRKVSQISAHGLERLMMERPDAEYFTIGDYVYAGILVLYALAGNVMLTQYVDQLYETQEAFRELTGKEGNVYTLKFDVTIFENHITENRKWAAPVVESET